MRDLSQIRDYMQKSYLCIDEYSDSSLSARLYKTIEEEAVDITGWVQIVNELDGYFDKVSYPQASTTPRSFKEAKKKEGPTSASELFEETEENKKDNSSDKDVLPKEDPKGSIATFIIQVVYRQNASWQGSLRWVEKDITKPFRSELELFKLIALAISGE